MKRMSLLFALVTTSAQTGFAFEPLDVWPEFAPGETSRSTGVAAPPRAGENPPVTRVSGITRPTFTVHIADEPNGSAAVILPGGGFAKVVPDKEGTEAADWLNRHGVSAFVLSYRTTSDRNKPGWKPALQDAQRTLSLVRSRAAGWGLKEDRIGLVAFSAGGQVGARLLSSDGQRSYNRIDEIDNVSSRPDFAMLIYPWNVYDTASDGLIDGVSVSDNCPPTFLVHTDNDRSSSLGAVLFYAGLKRRGIPSELHVYGNGGHGYGLRPVKGSQIASWPEHGAHWLGATGFLKP